VRFTRVSAHVLPDKNGDDSRILAIRRPQHRFDIRFWRDGTETKFEVLQGDPKAVERRSFAGQFASTPELD
jgi:hypothetical protein